MSLQLITLLKCTQQQQTKRHVNLGKYPYSHELSEGVNSHAPTIKVVRIEFFCGPPYPSPCTHRSEYSGRGCQCSDHRDDIDLARYAIYTNMLNTDPTL